MVSGNRRRPVINPDAYRNGGEAEPFNAEALKDVDLVIVDIGDTLVPTGKAYSVATRILYDGLAKESRLSMNEVADGLRSLPNQELLALPYGLNQHQALRERIPGVDLVEHFAPLRQRMFQAFLENASADRDTIDFLRRLKDQGRKVVFMTNLPEAAAHFVVNGTGLGGIADRIYAAPEIEQDPSAGKQGVANSLRLHETLGGGSTEPVTAIPAGRNARQQLAWVLAEEGADPDRSLRIADNALRDLAPANELGLRTALVQQHRASTDPKFVKTMRRLREGSGTVEPPQIMPPNPAYHAEPGKERPDYVIRTSRQMMGAAHHVDTGKPHPDLPPAAPRLSTTR